MKVSEDASKKVGRPRVLSDHEIALVRKWFPEIKSSRGQQNQAFAQRAVSFFYFTDFVDADRFQNFLPPKDEVEAGHADLPMTLLSHLGRLDPDLMLTVAGVISDREMSPKQAIAYIKQLRACGRRQGTQSGLVDAIHKAITNYTSKHKCEPWMLAAAVGQFSETVSELQRGFGGGDE